MQLVMFVPLDKERDVCALHGLYFKIHAMAAFWRLFQAKRQPDSCADGLESHCERTTWMELSLLEAA